MAGGWRTSTRASRTATTWCVSASACSSGWSFAERASPLARSLRAEGGMLMRRAVPKALIAVCVLLAVPLVAGGQAEAPRSPTPKPVDGGLRVDTVVRGLSHPWGLAFLPDGRMLVTERPGRLRIVERDG